MRLSYDERLRKLKAEIDRQREVNKQLIDTNNSLTKRLYDDSQNDKSDQVSELIAEKAAYLMTIDELRS